MSKPKFLTGFKSEKPVNLWLGVSLDNSKLRDDNLAVFAHIANKHVTKIKTLYIVVGCEIYGHYVGKQIAEKMGDEWVLKAKKYFNEENLKMPFKFVRWSELTATTRYKELFVQIQKDYESDIDFKNIVDSIAKEFHKKKNCSLESARNYLLDECAAYLLFDGKTTYPDKSLNLALQHTITKYKSQEELEYIGYDIGNGKISSNMPEEKNFYENQTTIDNSSLVITLEQQALTINALKQEIIELKKMMQSFIQHQMEINKDLVKIDEKATTSSKPSLRIFG
jgi:hypothetical protein